MGLLSRLKVTESRIGTPYSLSPPEFTERESEAYQARLVAEWSSDPAKWAHAERVASSLKVDGVPVYEGATHMLEVLAMACMLDAAGPANVVHPLSGRTSWWAAKYE
jgi:hypothetical protein